AKAVGANDDTPRLDPVRVEAAGEAQRENALRPPGADARRYRDARRGLSHRADGVPNDQEIAQVRRGVHGVPRTKRGLVPQVVRRSIDPLLADLLGIRE